MDSWKKWRIVCLTMMSVEDVEDVYIIGFLIAGFLLFGVCGYLAYREIDKHRQEFWPLQGCPAYVKGSAELKWNTSWRGCLLGSGERPGIWLFGFAIEKHQRDSQG
ncbi:hypothetical protein CHARACLAT_010191 [Characodon lateralis]|uniref:Uncharacterized protein n=1 Tax=Characodon lateralis TaxID=208331 RepID=A0ABU7D5I7_9TELE|nr:hypothetical protein [Characodon lateralis]